MQNEVPIVGSASAGLAVDDPLAGRRRRLWRRDSMHVLPLASAVGKQSNPLMHRAGLKDRLARRGRGCVELAWPAGWP